jgi:hypothetical protein
MKVFKRLADGRIVLDGIVWDTNVDRMISIQNDLTGDTVHSIKLDDVYYYPIGLLSPPVTKDVDEEILVD